MFTPWCRTPLPFQLPSPSGLFIWKDNVDPGGRVEFEVVVFFALRTSHLDLRNAAHLLEILKAHRFPALLALHVEVVTARLTLDL